MKNPTTAAAMAPLKLVPDTAFAAARTAASTAAILRQLKREHAIADNKSRLAKLFYSGPAMAPQASFPAGTHDAFEASTWIDGEPSDDWKEQYYAEQYGEVY